MSLLLDDEHDLLLELMTTQVVDQGAAEVTVMEMIPERLRADLPTGVLSSRRYAENALDLCERAGVAAVIYVVDYLIDNAGFAAQLGEMHKRLLAPRPRAPHPMEAIILQSGLPFANREPLRGMLRQMIDPGAFQQILQLSGEAGTGKSWTYYLIDHFCAREHSHIPCYYSVPEDAGLTAGPCEVAKDLVTQLGGNALQAPEQTANLEAYANELAHWVLSVANGINGTLNARVWFVLDGFSATALRPDTAKFLSTLARLCTTGLGARRHRTVFCQFEHALPSTLQLRVAKYRTEPITRDDIRDVIRAQASLRQDLAPDEVDAVAETLTTRVIGDLPEPFEDLTEIGANLIEALTGAQSYD